MRHDAEFIVKDFCNISELIRHSVSLYTKRDEAFFFLLLPVLLKGTGFFL